MAERDVPGWYARVEGADLVGKTTLINGVKAYSEEKQLDTVFIREPGQTRVGLQIRDLLLHETDADTIFTPEAETALFTADRRITWDSVTHPALEAGKTVIGDRGFESTVCYQAAGGSVEPERILAITQAVMPERYVHPDALVILRLSPEERLKRYYKRLGQTGVEADKIESRGLDYFRRVSEMYDIIGEEYGAHIIDADKSPDEVLREALPLLLPGHKL